MWHGRGAKDMRVFLATLGTETNTFASFPTGIDDFRPAVHDTEGLQITTGRYIEICGAHRCRNVHGGDTGQQQHEDRRRPSEEHYRDLLALNDVGVKCVALAEELEHSSDPGRALEQWIGAFVEFLASYFGVSIYADAIAAGLRMPNLLQNLLGEGTLSAGLVVAFRGPGELIGQSTASNFATRTDWEEAGRRAYATTSPGGTPVFLSDSTTDR